MSLNNEVIASWYCPATGAVCCYFRDGWVGGYYHLTGRKQTRPITLERAEELARFKGFLRDERK